MILFVLAVVILGTVLLIGNSIEGVFDQLIGNSVPTSVVIPTTIIEPTSELDVMQTPIPQPSHTAEALEPTATMFEATVPPN